VTVSAEALFGSVSFCEDYGDISSSRHPDKTQVSILYLQMLEVIVDLSDYPQNEGVHVSQKSLRTLLFQQDLIP
jgi:hypothetical protein